jgi:hypothetical protein
MPDDADLTSMTDPELAASRADIGNRLQQDLLTPESRRELEQRLRDVKAEIGRRAEAAEMRQRYQS